MLRKENKGITLVALVITIIILLILAGISISALTNTGIFEKAKDAKEKSEDAEKKQTQTLSEYEKKLGHYSTEELVKTNANVVLSKTENVELHDKNDNKIVIPAGFKVVSNEDTNDSLTVDKGIVIEDATVDNEGNATETNGNQFVWIPVGNITKEDGSIVEMNLDRCTFGNDAKPKFKGDNIIEDNYIELMVSSGKNIVAKQLENFKKSAVSNCGYYIGRYEARTSIPRNSKDNELTQTTEKRTDYVYNFVTQEQAAKQAQNMYDSLYVTSDLINSYAWDTAIVFIQNFGNDKKYSWKSSINAGAPAVKGTTNDVQCNIYDMASNEREWTTESQGDTGLGVLRGGDFNNKYTYTFTRYATSGDRSNIIWSFRPILYLNI